MINLCHFANLGTVTQADETESFGIKAADTFRLTTTFDIPASIPAYAVIPGTILLLQQSSAPDKVNLILRPETLTNIKLPVKYVIYRGLQITDFIESNDLSATTNKVKATGSALVEAMQAIQQARNPDDDIPVEALFGNDLNPANGLKIEEIFFKNLANNSQLFTVEAGLELGNFAKGKIGLEIILENPEFFPTVEMGKMDHFKIDVSSVTDTLQKNWEKEQIRHFVDPAAFYGLHHDIPGGIGYQDGTNQATANTPQAVYDEIVKAFATRNKVYFDIRNENGYSYNYYGNYTGTGPDADKIVNIGDSAATLALQEYYSNGWPLFTVPITPSATAAENEFFFSLKISDNPRPLLASWNTAPATFNVADPPVQNASDNRVYFIDETNLLPDPVGDFTNPVNFKVTNVPALSQQLSTLIRVDYIKQSIPLSQSAKLPRINFTDYLFGPLNTAIPWDSDNKIQWFTSGHSSYIDGLNDGYVLGKYKTTILDIDTTANEIEIFDEVPVLASEKVVLENNGSNNANEGTYTIQGRPTLQNGKTRIKVSETIPGALQSGDQLTLTVKIVGELDYTNNRLVIKQKDYTNLEVLATGNKLNFYSFDTFSSSYDIAGTTYDATNDLTAVAFTSPRPALGFAGYAERGHIIDIDQNTADADRIILYAAPQKYFSNNQLKKLSGFNAKGGILSFESVLNLLPGVTIKAVNLQPNATTNVRTLSYSPTDQAAEGLFLLGLTKQEFESIETAATPLSSNHLKLIKLNLDRNVTTDINKESYSQYELLITGLNATGVYQEIATGIQIYSVDQLIYTTAAFGALYDIDVAAAEAALTEFINETLGINGGSGNGVDFTQLLNFSPEEKSQLAKGKLWDLPKSPITKTNKILLDLEPTPSSPTATSFKRIITDLKDDLDASGTNSLAEIEDKLKEVGTRLYIHGRRKIRETDSSGKFEIYANRDGMIYISRLICQVIIKNHPTILSTFSSQIIQLSDVFEKASRGLEPALDSYPDFNKYNDSNNFDNIVNAPAGVKKILISGFDAFGAGADGQGYNSNPAGNIALSMDGVKIANGGKVAIIRAAVFPVRYREFNKGWVEGFFQPFINDVDMIVPISYGTNYGQRSIDHAFHLDRFAARYRKISTDNNEYSNDHNKNDYDYFNSFGKPYFDIKDKPFIINKLPFEKLVDATTNKITVPNTNIVVNYGNDTLRSVAWKVYARRKAHTVPPPAGSPAGTPDVQVPLGPERDVTSLFTIPSGTGAPSYFSLVTKVSFGRVLELEFKSDEKKFFSPIPDQTATPPDVNDDFIPNITWENYKDPALEANYLDFRIQAINGSGGSYLSNEIHYRVAYLRETMRPSLPNGHIHIGFLSSDKVTDRKKMLGDITHILEKFLEQL